MINEAAPTREVLAIKSFEALEKVADGQATKIIVPSDLQNLSSYTAVVKETLAK